MDPSAALPKPDELTGINAIAEQLRVINPSGINPDGRCFHCAYETAQVLTSERAPQLVNGSICAFPEDRDIALSIEPSENRPDEVFQWLTSSVQPGEVFLVEPESHAYNFVKGTNCKIYLIDASQNMFREIKTLKDFKGMMKQGEDEPAFKYNYADPSDGDEEETMDIYRCGMLNPKWIKFLK